MFVINISKIAELPTMMTASSPYTAVLTCHPGTHSQAVHGIEASVCWREGETIALSYVLKGNLSRLCIPPPRPPRRADRLWQHTCLEAFVSVKGDSGYYEFNFAPSGDWAVYTFRSYRDPSTRPPVKAGGHSLGVPPGHRGVGSEAPGFAGELHSALLVEEELAPKITVRRAGDSFELDAIVRVDHLLMIPSRAVLQLGLAAVVEEETGILSYWALKHALGKPDFHHPDAFVLALEPLHMETVNESAMDKR